MAVGAALAPTRAAVAAKRYCRRVNFTLTQHLKLYRVKLTRLDSTPLLFTRRKGDSDSDAECLSCVRRSTIRRRSEAGGKASDRLSILFYVRTAFEWKRVCPTGRPTECPHRKNRNSTAVHNYLTGASTYLFELYVLLFSLGRSRRRRRRAVVFIAVIMMALMMMMSQ